MIDYRIISKENYSNKIGELVTMLEHTRDVTLSEISNLNQSDLDFLPNGSSNTIGSLLSHIAAMEFVHQVISFEKRDLTESEYLKWRISLELGDKAREGIKKQSLDYYLNELSQVRENTLTYLKSKQDSQVIRGKTSGIMVCLIIITTCGFTLWKTKLIIVDK